VINNHRITPPFFELGPKAYSYGKDFVELAKFADQLSLEYDVRVIVTPQYVDIPIIAGETRNIFVFAQHMDSLEIGRGVGSVLPEAIKAAGADGVLLNHVEKRLSMEELEKVTRRAAEVELMTMVCADNLDHAKQIAELLPEIIIVESPDLIESGKRSVSEIKQIMQINSVIQQISPGTLILHGAGINNAQDVYDVIAAGAQGTGSTSGVMLAQDRNKALKEMIESVHQAWINKKNKF
jgi:triosephosphate isomerase